VPETGSASNYISKKGLKHSGKNYTAVYEYGENFFLHSL